MAIERGDTIYRFNGQYYVKSPSFPGTYQQVSPGSNGKSLIANKLVKVEDVPAEKFREEPSSKTQIRNYYKEEADRQIADASAQAQAGTITWDEADARVQQAESQSQERNTEYWDKRAAERAAQEERNRLAGTGGSGSGSGGSGGGSGLPELNLEPTGDPALDATLASLQGYLTELEKRGQVLNPNIVLDAKTLARFTKQAEQEIDPYYKGQLKMARESLLNSAGFSRDEVLRTEQDLERQYQQDFKQVGANAADQGFALSGQRVLSEENLARDTQNTIDSNRRNLEFQAGNQARQFAQQYGTSNMPTLNIGEAPKVYGGETGFNKSTNTRSLYQLDPNVYNGLVGSQEFEQRGAVRNRASQLEEAFRSSQALTQQRSLTL